MTKKLVHERFSDWGHFLKASNTPKEVILRSLEIMNHNNSVCGYLMPVSAFHLQDDELVNNLTKWRNEKSFAYPTRFNATNESTARWLKSKVIENDFRVMFLVVDLKLQVIGHLGVVYNFEQDFFELDNVLRGESTGKGLLHLAIQRLEIELETEFSIEYLALRVLLSNEHAINFYKKLNYFETSRISLTQSANTAEFALVPGEPTEDWFVTMKKSLEDVIAVPSQILTAGPSISSLESTLVFDATTNGWNNKHSEYLQKFEMEFAELVGVKYAMATSSCTGALHLALLALGIGEGDEVIVPEVTWVATASAVRYVGATPVFAEIKSLDWTIDPKSIEALITSRTRAIIPVHLYGYGADSPTIIDLAKKHNLFVVEDAAPAIGTEINGQRAGSFGDFGCYSFQGAKLLVTGEGGMLVTNDEKLFKKARKIQDHGRKPGTFWIEELGYKYKMNNITAALGLGQIRRSENQIFRKRRINGWYKEFLADMPEISFQEESPNTKSICWMTSVCLSQNSKIKRDEVIDRLATVGIDTRPVFPAISQYEFWPRKFETQPVAKIIGSNGINLPSGVMLTRKLIERVAFEFRQALK